MGFCKLLSVAIALFILSAGGNAFVNGLEENINIGESAYILKFSVENDSAIRSPLLLEFTAPTKYTLDAPEYVNANSAREITVKIYPRKGLEGTVYAAHIKIELGPGIAEKIIFLHYIDENACPADINAQIENGKILAQIENNSYREKQISITAIRICV